MKTRTLSVVLGVIAAMVSFVLIFLKKEKKARVYNFLHTQPSFTKL